MLYNSIKMNPDHVYAIIIVLMLIILGVITFHYYAYISSGNGSALNIGIGGGIKVLDLPIMKVPVEVPMTENFEESSKQHWVKLPNDDNYCPWALV
jgi:hypothetical protein